LLVISRAAAGVQVCFLLGLALVAASKAWPEPFPDRAGSLARTRLLGILLYSLCEPLPSVPPGRKRSAMRRGDSRLPCSTDQMSRFGSTFNF
jgi:hypothetical protein